MPKSMVPSRRSRSRLDGISSRLDETRETSRYLIGTLVTQYFLSDGTGRTVSEIYTKQNPVAGKGITAIFRKCARDKVVVRSFGDANWIGEGFEKFDCICLPLSEDGERVSMILHAFVFDRSSVLMAREVARANGGRLPSMAVRS